MRLVANFSPNYIAKKGPLWHESTAGPLIIQFHQIFSRGRGRVSNVGREHDPHMTVCMLIVAV